MKNCCQICPSYFNVFSNDDLKIHFTTAVATGAIANSKESRSFGSTHALFLDDTVSKITVVPVSGEYFKLIGARIYSTQTNIEIPLPEENLVRLVFHGIIFYAFIFGSTSLWYIYIYISFDDSTDNNFFCQRFPDLLKFTKPTEMMVIESLQNNEFYQKPYKSYSLPHSAADEETWTHLEPVKLSSTDFMIEMLVRQKVNKISCFELFNLYSGELLKIGNGLTGDSKLLTFNTKPGNKVSISFNEVQHVANDFVLRKVSNHFHMQLSFIDNSW